MPKTSPSHRGWLLVQNSAILAAVYNRALGAGGAALAANTAVPNVLVGTPVFAATPLDTIVISNTVADGDIVLAGRIAAGANSVEGFRYDTSAGLLVFNEASADLDFRIEGDNNANMLVLDAGTDSGAVGRAVVAGAFLSVDGSSVNRAGVTAVGRQLHLPAATLTQTNAASTTLAVGAGVFLGAQTFAGTNVTQTITDSAGLRVLAPVAGTNMTLTRSYGLWTDGQVRADSNFQVNNTATFATTQPTASVVFQSGTAPAGAITTGGAIFSSATVMRKIIADGTASNIET